MTLLIAIPITCVVLLMAICAFAGKPVQAALDEIQEEDAK